MRQTPKSIIVFRFQSEFINDISKRMYREIDIAFPPNQRAHARKGFDLVATYINTPEISPPFLYGGIIALIVLLTWKLLLGIITAVIVGLTVYAFLLKQQVAYQELVRLIASNRDYWEPLMEKVQHILERIVEERE